MGSRSRSPPWTSASVPRVTARARLSRWGTPNAPLRWSTPPGQRRSGFGPPRSMLEGCAHAPRSPDEPLVPEAPLFPASPAKPAPSVDATAPCPPAPDTVVPPVPPERPIGAAGDPPVAVSEVAEPPVLGAGLRHAQAHPVATLVSPLAPRAAAMKCARRARTMRRAASRSLTGGGSVAGSLFASRVSSSEVLICSFPCAKRLWNVSS
jgi:hypothetical protein